MNEFVKKIAENKVKIGIWIVVVTGITFLVSMWLPRVYESEALLLVMRPRITPATHETYAVGRRLSSLLHYAKSDDVALQVRDRFNLDMTMEDIGNNIHIRSPLETDLISVRVEYLDPDSASDIANFVAALITEKNDDIYQEGLAQTREFLQTKLENDRENYQKIYDELIAYKNEVQVEKLKRDIAILDNYIRAHKAQMMSDIIDEKQSSTRVELAKEQMKTVDKVNVTTISFKNMKNASAEGTYSPVIEFLKELSQATVKMENINEVYTSLEGQLVTNNIIAKTLETMVEVRKNALAENEKILENTRMKLDEVQKTIDDMEINLSNADKAYNEDLAALKTYETNYYESSVNVVSVAQAHPKSEYIRPKILLYTLLGFLASLVLSLFLIYLYQPKKKKKPDNVPE